MTYTEVLKLIYSGEYRIPWGNLKDGWRSFVDAWAEWGQLVLAILVMFLLKLTGPVSAWVLLIAARKAAARRARKVVEMKAGMKRAYGPVNQEREQ